jgi:hypothetical protein
MAQNEEDFLSEDDKVWGPHDAGFDEILAGGADRSQPSAQNVSAPS